MIATLDAPSLHEAFPELSDELQSDITNVCKMLADGNRLRIVFYLLSQPELNVTELCDRLGQSQPAVSHHLALLKSAQILKVRRDGKHNFYSIFRPRFQQVILELFKSMADSTDTDNRLDQFLLKRSSI